MKRNNVAAQQYDMASTGRSCHNMVGSTRPIDVIDDIRLTSTPEMEYFTSQSLYADLRVLSNKPVDTDRAPTPGCGILSIHGSVGGGSGLGAVVIYRPWSLWSARLECLMHT
jgi:hypothetical protein